MKNIAHIEPSQESSMFYQEPFGLGCESAELFTVLDYFMSARLLTEFYSEYIVVIAVTQEFKACGRCCRKKYYQIVLYNIGTNFLFSE